MPRQIPKIGDVFLVPLEDDSYCVGQVVETAPILTNSITCAFFDIKQQQGSAPDLHAFNLAEESVIACQFVTRDLFNGGVWRRLGNASVAIKEKNFPYRETKRKGWIGAKVIGSGIIRMFLSAYYGLRNWEEMKDPTYYENLLFRDRKRPTHNTSLDTDTPSGRGSI